MMNTLTWDIKPIALPKINSNLLSVVSLILLLTMGFITASVIADNCDVERRALENAEADLAWATAEAVVAELAWVAALGFAAANAWNPAAWLAVSLATSYKTFCIADVALKAERVSIARDALYRCMNPPTSASGGCSSGSCAS